MSREGQTLTTQRIDVSRLSLPLPLLTLSGGSNLNPLSPINDNIKSGVSPVMGNAQSLDGDTDNDPERRYNGFQHSHEEDVNVSLQLHRLDYPILSYFPLPSTQHLHPGSSRF